MLPDSYSSPEEDVRAAAALGFGGLALSVAKLKKGGDQELGELMRAAGLQAATCSLSVNSVLPQSQDLTLLDPASRVEAMCAEIVRLAPFSPSGIVALTGAGEGYARERAYHAAVEGLREVARCAARHRMQVSVEPVRYAEGTSLVTGLSDTVALLDDVACGNVGVCFDVWHHWDSPTLFRDLSSLGGRINSVHVADWRPSPCGRMDRALPGEGTIDLAAIIAGLEAAGFTGWYELEVFSDVRFGDSVLALPVQTLFDRGWAGFAAAWAHAGLA